MKFSVVTISYNQAPYLERCLESVLCQQGVELEYIVVDACSTDGSIAVLERYRHRLSQLLIEKDKGPADGLNKGFARAGGDILYYLNSDDKILPGAFAQVTEAFMKHQEADVIYGDGFLIDAEDRRIRSSYSARKFSSYRYLTGACVIVQQSTYFRRDAFSKLKGFNVANRTCWDGELLLDMAKAGAHFLHIPEFWGEFRVYPGSISGNLQLREQYFEDRNRMFYSTYGRKRNWQDAAADWLFRVGKHVDTAMQPMWLRQHDR
jgi:glycosyltransferase involved in cell wall biosynthesis